MENSENKKCLAYHDIGYWRVLALFNDMGHFLWEQSMGQFMTIFIGDLYSRGYEPTHNGLQWVNGMIDAF